VCARPATDWHLLGQGLDGSLDCWPCDELKDSFMLEELPRISCFGLHILTYYFSRHHSQIVGVSGRACISELIAICAWRLFQKGKDTRTR